MNPIIKCLIGLLIFCYAIGCGKSDKVLYVKEKGFLVLIEPDNWMFYPTTPLNRSLCKEDFVSKNLAAGISVPLDDIVDSTYSKIRKSLDTLDLVDAVASVNGMNNYVLFGAVEIEYEIDEKFHKTKSQLRSNLLINTRQEKIDLEYDQFPIKVLNVSPLVCLPNRLKNLVAPECQRSPDDPDGYLYKICQYLQSRDKYTDLPMKYKIVNTKLDTLGAKSVIKVTLSCCGLGDVAYFDAKTKELVHLRYGAK